MAGIVSAWVDQQGRDLNALFAASMLNPLNRAAQYISNWSSPNAYPSPGELIDLYNTTDYDIDWLKDRLYYHGISLSDPGFAVGDKTTHEQWVKVVERSGQLPSWDLCLTLRRRGELNDAQWKYLTERFGWKKELIHSISQRTPFAWSPEQLRVYQTTHDLDAAEYNKLLEASGISEDIDREIFEGLIQVPTYGESIEALNREVIDAATFDRWIGLEGYTDGKVKETLTTLAQTIPSEAELSEMAIKEVWNKEVVEKFGYDDEFDSIPQYRIWMQRTGQGGDANITRERVHKYLIDHGVSQSDADKQVAEIDTSLKSWAQAHWRAHWSPISPTQAYQMLHRLRPFDSTKPGPRFDASTLPRDDAGHVVPVHPFTMSDVQTVLKVNDYVPRQRPQLAAISYAVLRLVDIRRVVELSLRDTAFQRRTIGTTRTVGTPQSPSVPIVAPTPEDDTAYLTAWAREQFLDRGQTPDAATSLAALALEGGRRTIHGPERARRRRIEDRREKVIERQYLSYAISQEDYITLTQDHGKNQGNTTRLIYVIDREREQRDYEIRIKSIRVDYVEGGIDSAKAEDMLTQAGMIQSGIEPTIALWRTLQTTRRMMETTQIVLRWYNELLITHDDALARLERIGWSSPGALLELELPPPRKSRRGQEME